MEKQQIIKSENRGRLSFFFFAIWTFIMIARPQDYLGFLVPLRPILAITIVTLLAMFLQGFRPTKDFFRIREIRLILLFYVIMIIGAPFAVHKRVAFEFVLYDFLAILLYLFCLIMLVRSIKRLNYIIWIAVFSAIFAGYLYLVKSATVEEIRVSGSLTYDPNDFAMLFAIYIPLCVYVLLSGKTFTRKIISIVAIVVLVVGIIMTESRGGMIALGVILFGMLFLRTSKWHGIIKIAIILIICATAIFYLPRIETRFEGLADDYNWEDPMGRMNVWKQNLELLSKHPVLGVGANCADIALGFYRMALRGDTMAWQVSHSSILQVAVDTGIPGFAVFLMLSVGAILGLRKIRKEKNDELSPLSFFVELSFYGFWAGGIFLSHAYSINLYFLLGISAVIIRLHKNSESQYEKKAAHIDKQLREVK